MTTVIQQLASEYRRFPLKPLDKCRSFISTKRSNERIFPPYVPFVGSRYEEFRILVYATAQNLPFAQSSSKDAQLTKAYQELNDGDLVMRLYISPESLKPENRNAKSRIVRSPDEVSYNEVAIYPYQCGVLPALVGIYLYATRNPLLSDQSHLSDLSKVHQCLAVTNYYKFSMRYPGQGHGRDLNPATGDRYEDLSKYRDLADCLVRVEMDLLKPQVVISFHLHSRSALAKEDSSFDHLVVNDPAWVLKGGSGVFNKAKGTWYRAVQEIDDCDLDGLVCRYLEQLSGPYKYKKESVATYLKYYYRQWLNRKSRYPS